MTWAMNRMARPVKYWVVEDEDSLWGLLVGLMKGGGVRTAPLESPQAESTIPMVKMKTEKTWTLLYLCVSGR